MSNKRALSNKGTEKSTKRRKIDSNRWVSPFPIKETGKGFAIDSNTLSHPIRAGAKWDDLEQKQLLKLHKSKKYTLVQIANKLGRTQNAVATRLECILSSQSRRSKTNNQKKLQLNLSPINKKRKKQKSITPNTLSIEYPKTNSPESKGNNNQRKMKMNGFNMSFQQKSKMKKLMKPCITPKVSQFDNLPKLRIHGRNVLDATMAQNVRGRIFKKKHKKAKKAESTKQCGFFQTNNG